MSRLSFKLGVSARMASTLTSMVLAVVTGLLAFNVSAASVLVTNEGFETGTAPGWSGDFLVTGGGTGQTGSFFLRVTGCETHIFNPLLSCTQSPPSLKSFALPTDTASVDIDFDVVYSGDPDSGNFKVSLNNSLLFVTSGEFNPHFHGTVDVSGSSIELKLLSTEQYGNLAVDGWFGIDQLVIYANVAAIPEPEIYAMMGLGLGLLGWVGRKKRLKEAAVA